MPHWPAASFLDKSLLEPEPEFEWGKRGRIIQKQGLNLSSFKILIVFITDFFCINLFL